jgi:hypothetical protein
MGALSVFRWMPVGDRNQRYQGERPERIAVEHIQELAKFS